MGRADAALRQTQEAGRACGCRGGPPASLKPPGGLGGAGPAGGGSWPGRMPPPWSPAREQPHPGSEAPAPAPGPQLPAPAASSHSALGSAPARGSSGSCPRTWGWGWAGVAGRPRVQGSAAPRARHSQTAGHTPSAREGGRADGVVTAGPCGAREPAARRRVCSRGDPRVWEEIVCFLESPRHRGRPVGRVGERGEATAAIIFSCINTFHPGRLHVISPPEISRVLFLLRAERKSRFLKFHLSPK